MFATRYALGRVEVAFTDRDGGVSIGGRASLDLGAAETPDPAAVAENHRLLAAALGADELVVMRQLHGADVAEGRPGPTVAADALVTDVPGRALVARAADCVPVALADPERGLVAAVHAGRVGLVAGVVEAAVAALRGRGATDLTAWVGPRACGRCYEVPEALAAEVDAAVPGTRSVTSWGTPALDLGAGVVGQLAASGVRVVDAGGCTIEDGRFFSYRRQGPESGRHGVVVLRR